MSNSGRPPAEPGVYHNEIKAGSALLVCGYEGDTKFRAFRLEMAISFSEFLEKLPTLSKDQEIIFYCAWPQEATSAGQGEKYNRMGYKNVKALASGVEGWKRAGYNQV